MRGNQDGWMNESQGETAGRRSNGPPLLVGMLLSITVKKRGTGDAYVCADFPQNSLSLVLSLSRTHTRTNTHIQSLCGFGNFILTVGLAKDKMEQENVRKKEKE